MSTLIDDIQPGRCFRFSIEEMRQVLEIDGLRVRSRLYTAQGWGASVWTLLGEFAATAECEVACPIE